MQVGVTALLLVYICLNQLLSNTNLGVITVEIATNLPISYIVICPSKAIYYFSLKLVLKPDRTFYYIYNLFSPKSC